MFNDATRVPEDADNDEIYSSDTESDMEEDVNYACFDPNEKPHTWVDIGSE